MCIRILVADDERYTREGIVSSLDWQKYGIDCVMQAEDGEQALEIASWLQPEIVLTDIRMPKKNGIEFVEELKKTVSLVHCDRQHEQNAEQARELYTLMLTCNPSAIRQSRLPMQLHIPEEMQSWYTELTLNEQE